MIGIGKRNVFVHEVTGDVEDTTKDLLADWHGDGLAGVGEGHAAAETVGGGHGHGADPAVTEVLLDFEHELRVDAVQDVLDFKRVVDLGKLGGFREIGVNDGANDLDDGSGVAHGREGLVFGCDLKTDHSIAFMAVVISRSSEVMAAWRSLLYSSVSSLMNFFALSVAAFMATIRAECSEARDSTSIW